MSRWLVIFIVLAAVFPASPFSAGSAAAKAKRHHLVGSESSPAATRDDKALPSSPSDADSKASPAPDVALSPQEQQVIQIAGQNGDRDFLMIDKALGRLIAFSDGKPAWNGSALTGESPVDIYPPAVLALPESHKFTTQEKITPAGRFTVTRTLDDEEGSVFELDEVHGNGWYLAIHRVWTGIPSEHRRERLQSADPQEKHITFGCINVTAETMHYLTTHLPKKGKTVVYILPLDEALTASILDLGKPADVPSTARRAPRSKRRQVERTKRVWSRRYAAEREDYQ